MRGSCTIVSAFTLVLVLCGIVAPVDASQENALAIFNFRPTNFEAMGYDGEILYALISALEGDKSVELMPRREMEDLLYQKGLVQTDDPEMIAGAGKMLGINFVLFGSVTKKDAKVLADLQLMEIQSARVVKSWHLSFKGRESIVKDIYGFAGELSRALQETGFGAEAIARTTPQKDPMVRISDFRARSEGRKVILRWSFDPEQPIVGFHMYRSDHPDGPFQFVGRIDKNLFSDDSIKNGRNYYYRLGILLSNGREVKCGERAAIRNAGEKVPHPPLVLKGIGYVRRAEIKFVPSLINDQESFEITRYRIYRKKENGGIWENIGEMNAEMTSQSELSLRFEDTNGLKDGQDYTYAISSLDSKKRESPLSDAVSIRTIDRPVLSVEKEDLLRQVDVKWSPVENIEGYYVYRKSDSDEWIQVGKIQGFENDRFEDKRELEDGKTYRYHITVYDSGGESGPSNEVKAKTKERPKCPNGLKAESGLLKRVRLSWIPINDPDIGGYAIYRGIDPDALTLITEVKDYKSGEFTDNGKVYSPLEDGTTYYYAVASFNTFGAEGILTTAVDGTTKPRPQPVDSVRLSPAQTAGGKGCIQVRWSKIPQADIAKYVVYRSKDGGWWSKLTETPALRTELEDTDIKASVVYRYRIIAVDEDGLESDPFDSESVTSPITKE